MCLKITTTDHNECLRDELMWRNTHPEEPGDFHNCGSYVLEWIGMFISGFAWLMQVNHLFEPNFRYHRWRDTSLRCEFRMYSCGKCKQTESHWFHGRQCRIVEPCHEMIHNIFNRTLCRPLRPHMNQSRQPVTLEWAKAGLVDIKPYFEGSIYSGNKLFFRYKKISSNNTTIKWII